MSLRPSRRRLVMAAVCLTLLPALALAQAMGEPQPKLPTEPLTIETRDGAVTFEVEMAATPMQQSRGLMFRQEVPPLTGMLFVHRPPRPISMWMRNTPTSLDMLFINSDGVITGIAERTTPFSETVISSPGPMAGVLEILGGESERLGIRPGDTVEHPHFDGD